MGLNNPKVLVCLATYNGIAFLQTQLASILNQKNVSVKVIVSDDASYDGTYEYLQNLAQTDGRLRLLPLNKKLNSAGKNFYRLILDSDITGFDYIAFADQDDIWEPDKLIRHINLLKKHNVDGVSSNVMAFWPNGKKKLIKKTQPQRNLDYLFESAGPGCTFLMTPWLVNKLKQVLTDSSTKNVANSIILHDWLAYAVCRASSRTWYIDSYPAVHYRQHAYNVLGANSGAKAKLARINKIADGWYRGEVLKVVKVCLAISNQPKKYLNRLDNCLSQSGIKSRFRLLRFVGQARRSFTDRLFLAIGIIIGLF